MQADSTLDINAPETWKNEALWPHDLIDQEHGTLISLLKALNRVGDTKFSQEWDQVEVRFRCPTRFAHIYMELDWETFSDLMMNCELAFRDVSHRFEQTSIEYPPLFKTDERLSNAIAFICQTRPEIDNVQIKIWDKVINIFAFRILKGEIKTFANHEFGVDAINRLDWQASQEILLSRFAHGRMSYANPFKFDPNGPDDIFVSESDLSKALQDFEWHNGSLRDKIRSEILRIDRMLKSGATKDTDKSSLPGKKPDVIRHVTDKFHDKALAEEIWDELRKDGWMTKLGRAGPPKGDDGPARPILQRRKRRRTTKQRNHTDLTTG